MGYQENFSFLINVLTISQLLCHPPSCHPPALTSSTYGFCPSLFSAVKQRLHLKMPKLLFLAFFGVLWLAAVTEQVMIPEVPEQLETIGRGEEEPEKAESKDKAFDDSILSRDGRPESKPDQAKTLSLYRAQQRGRTELARVNLYVAYYQKSTWNQVFHCCPRRQNYGCRSYSRLLPCHFHSENGVREWCCPFYLNFFMPIYISNCNCRECAVFTRNCIKKGTCQRRYTRRSYYAICYRNNVWGFVRHMHRLLPSSCYCNTPRSTNIDIAVRRSVSGPVRDIA